VTPDHEKSKHGDPKVEILNCSPVKLSGASSYKVDEADVIQIPKNSPIKPEKTQDSERALLFVLKSIWTEDSHRLVVHIRSEIDRTVNETNEADDCPSG
jgi:hypothetical protein